MDLATLLAKLETTSENQYHGIKVEGDGPRRWEHHAWTVTITRGAETHSTPFKQGLGHNAEPTLPEVVSSLALDARAGELGSFEEFCGEFCYDTDSRRAEATYRACQDAGAAMRRLFGDHFDAVVGLAE